MQSPWSEKIQKVVGCHKTDGLGEKKDRQSNRREEERCQPEKGVRYSSKKWRTEAVSNVRRENFQQNGEREGDCLLADPMRGLVSSESSDNAPVSSAEIW